jgi:hypothetical protein
MQVRRLKTKSLLFAIICSGCATSSHLPLDDLAAGLAARRKSDDIRLVTCPTNTDALIGLRKDLVLSKLGTPDYVADEPDQNGVVTNEEFYFFKKRYDPADYKTGTENGLDYIELPAHGGFTELGLTYDANGQIATAQCRYTR